MSPIDLEIIKMCVDLKVVLNCLTLAYLKVRLSDGK